MHPIMADQALDLDFDLEGFLFSIKTCQGYPVALCGFCDQGTAGLQKERLRELSSLRYPESPDLYQVDALLAAKIKALALPSLRLAGASIRIPGIPAATGGILGDPHAKADSAGGKVENMGNGFWQLAFPGGPGAVLYGDEDLARRIDREFLALPAASAEARFFDLMVLLDMAQIPCYLLVSDGSGPGSFGGVAFGGTVTFCGGRKKSPSPSSGPPQIRDRAKASILMI
jgi:hypothetical protein